MAVDVERVKAANPIADVVVAHGVALRRSGSRFTARCPFHADTRPSFVVYPDTASFRCFGCGEHGDVVDFVRRTRDVGFREAIAYLGGADVGSRPVRRKPAKPTGTPDLTLEDRLILVAAAELYHQTLLRTPEALAYIEGRGIPRWLVQRARLGYSDGTLLQPYLHRRRLSLRRAAAMGLLYPSQQGGELREAMRGRVVIPDLRAGHVGWMTGRALSPDAQVPYLDLALPKPLLGHESARSHERVVVTEGPFDWLTLVAWGIPACALLGTHPGARPFRALDRLRSVLIVLDQDEAGAEATAALKARLGDRAVVVTLPQGIKDVNKLGQQEGGRDRLQQLIAEATGGGDEHAIA